MMPLICGLLAALIVIGGVAQTDARSIIEKSVIANNEDYRAAPNFNHTETDKGAHGSKTFQVTMIDGSPYKRLIATNGEPLSPARSADEEKQQEQVASRRAAESAGERARRIDKYHKGRDRDHAMMDQLTKAFQFQVVGEAKLNSFNTWVLKATPRADYQPPNMETQVLKGMEGELWIDQASFQWVKVTAEVLHPVSIEGILAQVEPGTRFELEKEPVEGNIWEPSHFSMQSRAKVLFLVNRSSWDDETFSSYQRASSSPQR